MNDVSAQGLFVLAWHHPTVGTRFDLTGRDQERQPYD
jgi:hypothetical protein